MAQPLNPSFEVPDPSGVPGEAADWQWDFFQAQGGLAFFNVALADEFSSSFEGFEGWWSVSWTWEYADAVARLAAGGFIASDVGGIAIQYDNSSLWLLTDHVGPTWALLPSERVQDWMAAFPAALTTLAQFNDASLAFASTTESFELWDGGPPWLDSLIFVDGEFRGWDDENHGAVFTGIDTDNFEEGWGTDVFGVSGRFLPSLNSKLVGQDLVFPLSIAPERRDLWVCRDMYQDVVRLQLTAGDYASCADLALEVQVQWAAANPLGTALAWSAEGDALSLAWNASDIARESVLLCLVPSWLSSDASNDLGLKYFGPRSSSGALRVKASRLRNTPSILNDDDEILLNTWSLVDFALRWDDPRALYTEAPSFMEFALFDSATNMIEGMPVSTWYGGLWRDEYLDGDLTFAFFQLSGVPYGREGFEDLADWPDMLYP